MTNDIVANLFYKGAQAYKDKALADIVWFAESAPNQEAVNHMWEMITHLMKLTVTHRGSDES
jgi:hypothetical protein